MNDLQVLFIAGNWTDDGGRSSNYMSSVINSFENKLGHPILSYNGGNVDDLPKILEEHVPEVDLVFWSPNIPYELRRDRRMNPKDYNHRVTLVTFKRNDGRLTFDDMMSISITLRADLTCEVRKNSEGRYEMRIYDILGNLWSDYTTNTAKSVATLVSRGTALKTLHYTRFKGEDGVIVPQNENIDEIVEIYKDFGKKLIDVSEPSEHVKRHLGEISFRGSTDKDSEQYNLIFSSERNLRLSDTINESNFVATRINQSTLVYYGNRKPHLNSAVFDRLFNKLQGINYIFSSQCYIKGAKFTDRILTKGCNQELSEIMKVIEENNFSKDPINILGQGSIILGRSLEDVVEQFANLEKREIPEPIGIEFDAIQFSDGVDTFYSVLGGQEIQEGELLEVQFLDGSAGTYEVHLNEFTDSNNKSHKEAYVDLNVKGVPIEFPITGALGRRI